MKIRPQYRQPLHWLARKKLKKTGRLPQLNKHHRRRSGIARRHSRSPVPRTERRWDKLVRETYDT